MLPESVGIDALLGAGRAERGAGADLFIPFGIGDETLEPAGFELDEGDHAMIAGPARTGRTTALRVVAEVIARLYPDILLIGVATRRSALRECTALTRVVTSAEELGELVPALRDAERLQVLLVDDADVVDDPTRGLSDLFGAPRANLHAIVAGRTDALKTLGHWSVGVRRARTGLLLQPDVQVDGPLLGVTLPRARRRRSGPGAGTASTPAGSSSCRWRCPPKSGLTDHDATLGSSPMYAIWRITSKISRASSLIMSMRVVANANVTSPYLVSHRYSIRSTGSGSLPSPCDSPLMRWIRVI